MAVYRILLENYVPCECGGHARWMVRWDEKGLFNSVACDGCKDAGMDALPILYA